MGKSLFEVQSALLGIFEISLISLRHNQHKGKEGGKIIIMIIIVDILESMIVYAYL
jgi:hypothetical protein